MSVLRGLILRRLNAVLPTKTSNSRTITLLLSLTFILGATVVSTDLLLSGLAARREKAENSINSTQTSNSSLSQLSSRGPLAPAKASAAAFTPFQACALNCGATVPATGNSGVAVQFLSTATATGCTTQPSFDWNFGDGTAHSSQV